MDRDRDHGRAGLERDLADAALGLAEVAGSGAATLGVHEQEAVPPEDRVGGLEGLDVVEAAADREDAPVLEDDVQDRVARRAVTWP